MLAHLLRGKQTVGGVNTNGIYVKQSTRLKQNCTNVQLFNCNMI